MNRNRYTHGMAALLLLGCVWLATEERSRELAAQDSGQKAPALRWELGGSVVYEYEAKLQWAVTAAEQKPQWKDGQALRWMLYWDDEVIDAGGRFTNSLRAPDGYTRTVKVENTEVAFLCHLLELLPVLPEQQMEPGKKWKRPSAPAVCDASGLTQEIELTGIAAGADGDLVSLKGVLRAQQAVLDSEGREVKRNAQCDYTLHFNGKGYAQRVEIGSLVLPTSVPDYSIHLKGEVALVAALKPGDAEIARRVEAAIAEGVEYLASKQLKSGAFSRYGADSGSKIKEGNAGSTALCVLALLQADVSPGKALFTKAFNYLAECSPEKYEETYTPTLICLAVQSYLERYSKREALPEGHANKLARMESSLKQTLDKLVRDAAERLNWIYVEAKKQGFTYTAGNRVGHLVAGKEVPIDYSNTQFGVIGLMAASRCGENARFDFWKKMIEAHVEGMATAGADKVQPEYSAVGTLLRLQAGETPSDMVLPKSVPYYAGKKEERVAMAWGALGTLAAARTVLIQQGALKEDMDRESLQAMRSLLAYLQDKGIREQERQPQGCYCYTLFSIEKAASLCGLRTIGKRDWFFKGASGLCARQQADGSWASEYGSNVATSFALLFLARGTQHLSVVTEADD